jgi:hypothetical protein
MDADDVKFVREKPGRYHAAHNEGIIVSREEGDTFWFITYEGNEGDDDDRMILAHRLGWPYETLKESKPTVACIRHCPSCGRFAIINHHNRCDVCQSKIDDAEREEKARKWEEERRAKLTEIVETVVNYTALARNQESIDNAIKALDELLSYSLRFKREER